MCIALATFTMVRGLLLAAVLPIMHGPDEPAHFDYVQALSEGRSVDPSHAPCTGGMSPEVLALTASFLDPIAGYAGRKVPDLSRVRLPDPGAPQSRATRGCASASMYPPLYYWAGEAAYRLADASLPSRVFAVRAASALLGAAMTVVAFVAGFWFFGSVLGASLLAVVVMAQPQIWFTTSIVNNDGAMLLGAFGCFAAAATARHATMTRRAQLVFALCFLGGALAKPTLLFYTPVLFMVLAVSTRARSVAALARATVPLVPGVLLGGAWQVLHPIRHLGPGHHLTLAAFLSEFVWNRVRAEALWIRLYWMTWGWIDTSLRTPYYRLLELMLVAAAVGLVAAWRIMPPDRRVVAVLGLGATGYGIVMLYALEFHFLRVSSIPAFVQGRYLLPVYPLTAGALLVGLEGLSAWGSRFDLRWTLPLMLLCLDVAGFAQALSRYYGT